MCTLAAAPMPTEKMVGLPFVRSYSLNEIGASRGARLSFDHLGRIGVLSGSSYAVLNDNTWLQVAAEHPNVSSPHLLDLVWQEGNRSYYGTLGGWGRAELQPDGHLTFHSLRPDAFPYWVRSTNFKQVLVLEQGVLFAGYNGIVYEDETTGRRDFIELPELTRVFQLGSAIYVSTFADGLLRLDLDAGSTEVVASGLVVDEVARVSPETMLFSTTGDTLMRLDAAGISLWHSPLGTRTKGSVSCLAPLPEGGVAMAVDGEGVFVFSPEGNLLCSLTTAEYQRVFDIAANEEGVLWLTTEVSVQKVLYRTGISVIDQRSGVIVEWPQVIQWRGNTVIASHGRLYDLTLADDGLSYRFEQVAHAPTGGAWGVDGSGEQMLVGNATGVYARMENGFQQVLGDLDASRLVMTEDGLCYVIGMAELAILRWNGSQWTECAPRVPGVGFPWVVHSVGHSAWIELGLNLAARISYRDGQLRSEVFDLDDWGEPTWVNLGSIGDTVVLSGPDNERRYYDEATERFIDAPELDRKLSEAPYPIKRIAQDAEGYWWGAHENGILVREGMDLGHWESPFAGRFPDRYPVLHLVGDDQIWVSTESSFYRLDREMPASHHLEVSPQLVSVTDGRTGDDLYSAGLADRLPEAVPYDRNHLVFRFFAGGYPTLQALSYRFHIRRGSTEWTMLSTDSLLALPNLWEGDYEVEAQLLDGGSPIGRPAVVAFRVEPPWFRQPVIYPIYGLLLLTAVGLFRAYVVRQASRKHAMLEKLVHERTEKLKETMARLTDEVRLSATLAERNRLAEEMHDSVQQGLTGLILQLDATLKLAELQPEVRSRLTMARKMVSFTREEVQQAIWDLESPFLEDADLAGALRTMAQMVTSGSPAVEVSTAGRAIVLEPSKQHHLLRIAQEAITNAMRHSHTDRIDVSLVYEPERVVLEVRDYGTGFSTDEALAEGPGHFGLRGMRARVAKIDGRLNFVSRRGQGTTVRIELPIAPSQERRAQFTDDYSQDQNPARR
ncbi:MAG: sensor histidine kinase [Verrucomicrobiota bacterium JB022]|nr:sensor histidine kinase [Verrucomicrobiota bacterium JB022]